MRDRVLPLHPSFQPLFFMGAAFAGGVYLERFLGPAVSVSLLLALALTCGSCCAVVHWHLCRLESNLASEALASKRSVASVAFFAVLLVGYGVLGTLSARAHAHHAAEHRLRRLLDTGVISPDDPVEVIGRLVSPPERAPVHAYLDVGVERITTRRQTYHASGRLRLMMMLSNEVGEFDRLQEAGLGYGARLRILTRLDRPRSYRNPGVSDYSEYLEARGYDLAGVVKSPLLITVLERNDSLSFRSVVYDLRELAERRIDQLFSARTAGVLKALLLGNRYFLDEETTERFRAGGTFHLLVISGAHIAALAGAILWLISRYTRRWALRALPTIFLLWTYTVAVGEQAPVTRATVMMTVMLAAPFVFRRAQPVNTVGLAALLLLGHNPQELASPSFQLTFLAATSIVLLSLPFVGHLQAIGQWRPTVETPEPPSCSPVMRLLAETLFWDERRFQKDQQASPIRFRLDKADAARWLSRLPGVQPLVRFCVLSLLVSGVAQIVLLPLMAIYFHRVVLVGIVLNVVISLFVALIGSSAILALGLSVMSLSLSYPVAGITDRLANAMMRSFDFPLSFRGASFRVPEYSGPGAAIYVVYYVALVYWAARLSRWQPVAVHPRQDGRTKEKAIPPVGSRRSRRRLLPHLVAMAWVVSFLLIVIYPVSHRYQKGWLRLHFLDVGQGDCVLLELPDGTTMLVDGGGEFRWEEIARKSEPGHNETSIARGDTGEMEPDFTDDSRSVGEVAVSPALWARGIKRITYLALTHADVDHLDGLFAVVKNFDVGRVLIAQPPVADARFDRFMRILDSRWIPVQVLGMGDRFQMAGVQFAVLWPPRQDAPPLRWSNNRSLVLRLSYGEVSILLAGDIEQAEERALLDAGFDLHSQVLKVPHHGSRTSSTEPFLARVQPTWAIITAPERSRFLHPHPDVVQRYHARGVCLLQTGHQGMITFETDGRILHVRTRTGPPPTNCNPAQTLSLADLSRDSRPP